MKFLCRIGIHRSTFLDCAMGASAHKCNDCHQWVDAAAGAHVESSRALFSQIYAARESKDGTP